MIVRHTLQVGQNPRPPLTPERIAEIEARAPRDEDIVYDEDLVMSGLWSIYCRNTAKA